MSMDVTGQEPSKSSLVELKTGLGRFKLYVDCLTSLV